MSIKSILVFILLALITQSELSVVAYNQSSEDPTKVRDEVKDSLEKQHIGDRELPMDLNFYIYDQPVFNGYQSKRASKCPKGARGPPKGARGLSSNAARGVSPTFRSTPDKSEHLKLLRDEGAQRHLRESNTADKNRLLSHNPDLKINTKLEEDEQLWERILQQDFSITARPTRAPIRFTPQPVIAAVRIPVVGPGPEPDPIKCDGRFPYAFTFKLTGGDCDDSDNQQTCYWCADHKEIGDWARIIVGDEDFKELYFEGDVKKGHEFEVKTETFFKGYIAVKVMTKDVYGQWVVAQFVKFLGTCQEPLYPLYLGDIFGAIEVAG